MSALVLDAAEAARVQSLWNTKFHFHTSSPVPSEDVISALTIRGGTVLPTLLSPIHPTANLVIIASPIHLTPIVHPLHRKINFHIPTTQLADFINTSDIQALMLRELRGQELPFVLPVPDEAMLVLRTGRKEGERTRRWREKMREGCAFLADKKWMLKMEAVGFAEAEDVEMTDVSAEPAVEAFSFPPGTTLDPSCLAPLPSSTPPSTSPSTPPSDPPAAPSGTFWDAPLAHLSVSAPTINFNPLDPLGLFSPLPFFPTLSATPTHTPPLTPVVTPTLLPAHISQIPPSPTAHPSPDGKHRRRRSRSGAPAPEATAADMWNYRQPAFPRLGCLYGNWEGNGAPLPRPLWNTGPGCLNLHAASTGTERKKSQVFGSRWGMGMGVEEVGASGADTPMIVLTPPSPDLGIVEPPHNPYKRPEEPHLLFPPMGPMKRKRTPEEMAERYARHAERRAGAEEASRAWVEKMRLATRAM
ncbi:uncharacterized protein MKK02DRAFT_43269 [Dioszegia hungarica]|uniref:Uncharacterized protein n=1 Tax=Dioszegia hungarica TaxID=4972 RepID=A0AA38HEH1_9TREE|nr:uncharacterized protein MKK02DRAFT_43269 [Dioszegia hungarica]KAI9637344.1 hypothetical protein MKK02DRAFT_43269 [Dioszegia hungarica]